MHLKPGILIIGSLFWDSDERGIRQAWRDSRLEVDQVVDVQAPIRYGRLSQNATYTMVLSNTAPPGCAKVVPCTNQVNNFADLLAEARHLWGAEVKQPDAQAISEDWGCVALLLRESASEDLLSNWAAAHQNPLKIDHAKGESPIVSPSGILQMA